MAEILRKITDKIKYGDSVVARPSRWDEELVILLDQAHDLVNTNREYEARKAYLKVAKRAREVFDTIPVTTKRARKDRGEYGLMVVSALVSAHENIDARAFEALKFAADSDVPTYAKERAAKLTKFLEQNPQW